MKKLVLTGAAGRLGSYLREPLSKLADALVSTDLVDDIGKLYAGESYVKANLESLDAMTEVLKGADMVVHFGAIGDEAPFDKILGPNCSVPPFGGAKSASQWRDSLWDKFYTGAPQQLRRSVEQYKIVKRA
jgi:hypothetical protein